MFLASEGKEATFFEMAVATWRAVEGGVRQTIVGMEIRRTGLKVGEQSGNGLDPARIVSFAIGFPSLVNLTDRPLARRAAQSAFE